MISRAGRNEIKATATGIRPWRMGSLDGKRGPTKEAGTLCRPADKGLREAVCPISHLDLSSRRIETDGAQVSAADDPIVSVTPGVARCRHDRREVDGLRIVDDHFQRARVGHKDRGRRVNVRAIALQ